MIVLWVTRGHLYLWLMPLLAPVSTMGKSRLVVVAVQGAPRVSPSCASSVSVVALALALLRVSENDIGEDGDGDIVVFGAPSARPVARDHPAMEERGVAVVSWSPVPASGVTTATRFGSRYRLHRWN